MKLTTPTHLAPEKVLIVGLSGSGKSTLASKLATKFHLHWIDLERGAKVLYKLPKEAQDNVDVYRIPDSASFPVGSQTMTQLWKNGKMHICHEHGAHNCAMCTKDAKPFDDLDFSKLSPTDIVVLDTGTQLSHSILAHVTRSQPIDYKPERDDWGALRKLTEFFCSQFQASPVNLIVICHLTEAELTDGATKLVPNFGSASMSAEFSKAFDHVVYCEIKNGKYAAGSSGTYSPKVLTKSRTDFMIEKLPIPSLEPVFDGSHLANYDPQQDVRSPAQIALDNLKKQPK